VFILSIQYTGAIQCDHISHEVPVQSVIFQDRQDTQSLRAQCTTAIHQWQSLNIHNKELETDNEKFKQEVDKVSTPARHLQSTASSVQWSQLDLNSKSYYILCVTSIHLLLVTCCSSVSAAIRSKSDSKHLQRFIKAYQISVSILTGRPVAALGPVLLLMTSLLCPIGDK